MRCTPLDLPPDVAVKVPKDFEGSRDHRVSAEDVTATEVGPETLEDDDVRGQNQEVPSVVRLFFDGRVEELRGNRERHDLRLAATGCHLDGIAGKVVVLKNVNTG